MENRLLIGLDFGSDSVRALLCDEHGKQLSSAVSYYRRWADGLYCDASENRFRHHPLDYLESMEEVLKGVLKSADPGCVAGIALDATGSTPVAVNQDGCPLALLPGLEEPDAMFLLWKDHSSIEEAARINEVAANWPGIDYRMYEGGRYSSEWFWSKLLHVLRHSEAVRQQAFSFVELCDWATGALCDNINPLTMARSRCAAGHKALWHASWGGLPPEDFLSAIDPMLAGFRSRLYTETRTADLPAGKIAPKWAAKLGLPENVVIGGSALDGHTGTIGAEIGPGDLVKILGTSSCDMAVANHVSKCVRGICGQVDGSILPGLTGLEAGQSAFGDVYAWFKRLLGYAGDISLADLEKEAAAVPPGANGVFALDWFNGRRTPDSNERLTGAIGGLTLASTAPMIYRALVESTLFGTRAIAERLREEGIPVSALKAVGGISRKSPMVMQLCADILQIPVQVCACDQATALGAAMYAAVGAGIYPTLPEAMKAMGAGFDRTYNPTAELASVYETLYQRYRALGQAMERIGQ
ncbi:MAG: ribulokinase [Victivallales bacterium]|nr:ribulokinase [Victivallales bacterium]